MIRQSSKKTLVPSIGIRGEGKVFIPPFFVFPTQCRVRGRISPISRHRFHASNIARPTTLPAVAGPARFDNPTNTKYFDQYCIVQDSYSGKTCRKCTRRCCECQQTINNELKTMIHFSVRKSDFG